MNEQQTGRAWIEINKTALHQNVLSLQSRLPSGCRLMPAVKANAYGHGAVEISKELSRMGIDTFCVASVEEGVELREAGIKGEILVLGYTAPFQFPLLHNYHLTQTILSSSYADTMNDAGEHLNGHIKVDTGMHRLGERAEQLKRIEHIFDLQNIKVTGVFTHLFSDESKNGKEKRLSEEQAREFSCVISYLNDHGLPYGKAHILSSYGVLNYPEFGGDYARVGIALYGVLSNRADLRDCPIELVPVLSLKTRIAQIKVVKAGEGVGYGWKYIADCERIIAVLTIGYADGIPRALSCGKGRVLVNGHYAPVVGNICMDQMMVDVTDIPAVKAGDAAVIIGKSGDSEITAYDLAEPCGTITNEILSRLGRRIEVTIV